jgi:membrane protease YdiL (CAAX protease family)
MKTLRAIFTNLWVLLGLAVFGVSLALLWRNPGFGREDALGGIVIFGFIQGRLATWFKSEISGVALMSLLFGLAHVPGFILRRAGLADAIGENPSALDAIAYAVVVLSVSGIFFGIVWARTRNLFAVMFIHAATDLLPNFKQFVSTWGI